MLAITCYNMVSCGGGVLEDVFGPEDTFWLTCVCVLGPWPRVFLSLASRGSFLGRAVLGLRLFLCLWPRALCPRLHLWYHVFINAIIVGVKVFHEVGTELEKRVKCVLCNWDGRGAQKKHLGATCKFFPQLQEWRPKKGLHFKLRLVDTDRLPPFGAQFLLWELVHSLAVCDGILRCESQFLPTNSGVKTKKKAILCFILAFTSVFHPGTRLYSRLRGVGTSSSFPGHKPQNALQWHQACYFLVQHNPRFWSTISDLGARPQNALHDSGPEAKPSYSATAMLLSSQTLGQGYCSFRRKPL